MVLRNAEYGKYPYYPEPAGSQHGNYCWSHRKSHSAYRAHYAVHKSAGEIEAAAQPHSYKSRGYNVWTRVVNAQQGRSEQVL